MTLAEERRRIAWRCRRGMLELDHLLGRILDRAHEVFDDRDWEAFDALLNRPDQEIVSQLLSPEATLTNYSFINKIQNIINNID